VRAIGIAVEGLALVLGAALGVRLLWLFLARGAPFGLVAIAVLLGGAPIHALTLLLVLAGFPSSEGAWQAAYAGLYTSAGIASTCILRFNHEVFRPGVRWMPVAIGAAAGFHAIVAATLPFASPRPTDSGVGLAFLGVLACGLGWSAWEGGRVWLRVLRAGTPDRAVAERFAWVGAAAVLCLAHTGLMAWGWRHGGLLLAAGAAGLGVVGSLWLALIPPVAWVRWRRRSPGSAGAPARPRP
jgi:hypothetical protein